MPNPGCLSACVALRLAKYRPIAGQYCYREVNNASALYAWIPAMHCCCKSHLRLWDLDGLMVCDTEVPR